MLTDNQKTLSGKIAKFLFLLLAFLGIEEITEVLDEVVAQAKTFDPTVKPTLLELGDSSFDALSSGGELITDETKKGSYEKWVAIIKSGFDTIEGGGGAVIAFFKALIAGHDAKKAAAVNG